MTLIEIEALQALARNDPPCNPDPSLFTLADHRRNLTTEGIPLNHLVGRRFPRRRSYTCRRPIEFPLQIPRTDHGVAGVHAALNRSGLNCSIELGGIIRKGDPIEPL